MFDVFVAKGIDHAVPLLWREVALQALSNLSTDLLHDLHVRALGYLSCDLHLVPMRRDLLDLMLGDLLIEYLVIELLGRPVHQPVIELASVGLHQVHLPGGGTVGQLVGPAFGIGIYPLLVHHLFVREGRVLHGNQALSWGRVLPQVVVEEARLTCVLLDVVIHDPIEPFVFPANIGLLSVLKQLIEQGIILPLDGFGLILKFFVSIVRLGVAWPWDRAPRLFASGIGEFFG